MVWFLLNLAGLIEKVAKFFGVRFDCAICLMEVDLANFFGVRFDCAICLMCVCERV
jgi:bacterioferritin-associated ferredoxin